jgi:molybdopterin synthase catalytic subunit
MAAAAAHRDAAFAACRYLIEQVKRRVPIWKREYFADGTVSWVEPRQTARPAEAPAEARPGTPPPPDHTGHTDWGV